MRILTLYTKHRYVTKGVGTFVEICKETQKNSITFYQSLSLLIFINVRQFLSIIILYTKCAYLLYTQKRGQSELYFHIANYKIQTVLLASRWVT